mgnify:CR=1 FL=1|jgi:hypothetical protein
MDLMRIILGLEKEEGRESNFQMALKSARLHTGRNVDTGVASSMTEMECNLRMKNEVQENQLYNSELFTGLTIYLILLEQIGSMFKRTGLETIKGYEKGIKYSLYMFSTFTIEEDKDKIDAINCLRNNLAHNFGLASDDRFPNSGRKFTLSFSNDAPIVKLPAEKWNCQYDDKGDESSTVIGVYAFCNEVEQIVGKLIEVYHAGNLEFSLSEEEIKSRFTIIV